MQFELKRGKWMMKFPLLVGDYNYRFKNLYQFKKWNIGEWLSVSRRVNAPLWLGHTF